MQTVDEGECYATTGSPGPYLAHKPYSCGVPFARHESGDYGVIEVSLSTCGRGLPRLVGMSGVTSELFVTRPGEKVFAPSISLEALSLPSVQLYRIVQDRRG
jgi:phenylacetate-coenzyme A ligase PaaK-like adenylate-forming protein